MPKVEVTKETVAMDALVNGKTDSELLEIMVQAIMSNNETLLGKMTGTNVYTNNDPDAAIVGAICRHIVSRLDAPSDSKDTQS